MDRRLVFTPYSLRRLAQRRITREEAQTVVDHPETILPSPHHPARKRYRATVAGRRLSIVVEMTPLAAWTVVTAYDEDQED